MQSGEDLRKPEDQCADEERAETPVDRCRSLTDSYRNGLNAANASKVCANK